MAKNERNFFLEGSGRRIYCVEYSPDIEVRRDCCVVLCKPIWGERIRTHRIFTNVARTLRGLGYYVATCDYFGDGNSGGETSDLTFSGMVDDVQLLSRYLVEKAGVEKIAIVGLRFGANVAIHAEPGITGVERMILFEPIQDPSGVLTEWLRANLTSQMAVHKKIIKSRDDLIADLKRDVPVNIDGFVIGKKFWESFEAVTPFEVNSDFTGPVYLYSLAPKGRKQTDHSVFAEKYQNCQMRCMESEFIWTGWKKHVPNPPNFISAIVAEMMS